LVRYQYSGMSVWSGLKTTPCSFLLTAVYRWLATAQPVDPGPGRRIVGTVWKSLRAPSP
jgi:hypothetical protein